MLRAVSNFKSTVTKNVVNIPGWRTKRKLIVIESDDWGSIRMPSQTVFSKFLSKGFNLANSAYNRIDSLESNEDLMMLFSVLSSFRDSFGNPPVITANVVVANPDFKKIKLNDFNEYFFESVAKTLSRYPKHDMVESLWKQGNSDGIFHPQFHGREHVNIVRWMNALRERTPEIMYAFDHETTFSGDGDYNFMEVLDYNSPEELFLMKQSLVEGLSIFERNFGFKSKSFIPPCYTWSSDIEKTLHENGIKYLQGLVIQSVPTGTFGKYGKKYHFMGNKNKYGQLFLIRNCFFEPSLTNFSDPVGECLSRINIAFNWMKPAVISTHRINFIGTLDERNRTKNLLLFKDLLTKIINKWPDVEFITTDQLGDLIVGEKRIRSSI